MEIYGESAYYGSITRNTRTASLSEESADLFRQLMKKFNLNIILH